MLVLPKFAVAPKLQRFGALGDQPGVSTPNCFAYSAFNRCQPPNFMASEAPTSYFGHGAPAAVHALNAADNSSWLVGGGSRGEPSLRAPGDPAHCTSASRARCSSSPRSPKLPLRVLSSSRSQSALPPIATPGARSKAIDRGASRQFGAPGTPLEGSLSSWWHAVHRAPGAPRSSGPRTTRNWWICRSSPWRG